MKNILKFFPLCVILPLRFKGVADGRGFRPLQNASIHGELYLSQDITSDTWAAFKETTYVVFSCTVPSGDYADGNNPGSIITNQGVNQYAAARLFDRNGDGRIDINDFCEKQYVDYLRLYQINSRKYSLSAK